MNILNLPPGEQQRIHIERIASLAVHNFKRGNITRREVQQQIDTSADSEMMRDRVNFYLGVKKCTTTTR